MKNKVLPLLILVFYCFIIKHVGAQTCQSYTYTATSLSTSLSGGNYSINSNIVLSTDITIADAEILMAAGTSITVPNGYTLTIAGSHLYACTDMWQGIIIETGGKLIIDQGTIHDNSLIEDADVGVELQYVYDNANLAGANALTVGNTIFNRNRIGIDFGWSRNYNSSYPRYYPVALKNSIFTCRDIPFIAGSTVWVDFTHLKNTAITYATAYPNTPATNSAPYIDEAQYSATNTYAFLKAPYQGTKSEAGINFGNYGATHGGYHFNGVYKIGDERDGGTTNNVTIFDNQTVGARMNSIDIQFANCTFQNTPSANPNLETYGILAEHYDEAGFHLDTRAVAGTPHNAFFDCKYAIKSKFYTQVNIENTDIRSSKIAPLGSIREGYEGINVTTNSFGWQFYNNAIYINSNEIVNVAYPITLRYDVLPWYATGSYPPTTNTELTNIIEVNKNIIGLIPAATPGFPVIPSEYFVQEGINLEVVVPTAINSATIFPPLRCNNNYVGGAYHCIRISNWEGKNIRVLNNSVGLNFNGVVSLTSTGIVMDGCIPQQSAANFVYGNWALGCDHCPGINPYNHFSNGFTFNNGTDFTIRCNIAWGALRPEFQFLGNIPNTYFFNNFMDPHPHGYNWGMMLSNAIIGTQGNAGMACDNSYGTGSFWSTGLKTICSNSDATFSPMYVQLGVSYLDPSGFNGAFNGGTPYNISNGSLQGGSPNGLGCPNIDGRIQLYNEEGAVMPPIDVVLNTITDENDILIRDARLENKKIVEAVQLANGQLLQTGVSEPHLRQYVAQMELYKFLLSFNGWTAKSAELRAFVNRNRTSSFGMINAISTNIMKGDTTLALQQLSNWKKTNRVDENYGAFLTWTIRRRQHQPMDTAAIEQLALQCPQTDGNVVFAAQNLYNAITNLHRLFSSACNVFGTSVIAKTVQTPSSKTELLVQELMNAVTIYPNPAQDIITIKCPDIRKVELLNTYGSVLLSKKAAGSTVTLSLNNLSSSIYYIKVTDADNKTIIKKIIKTR